MCGSRAPAPCRCRPPAGGLLGVEAQGRAWGNGVTWKDYGQDLEETFGICIPGSIAGADRARPSRRVYIRKPDGRRGPPRDRSLVDKLLQRAVVEVLNAIYETDFLGFSHGFRPGRSPHDALDALAVGLRRKRVNWVLDADFREFFTRP